MAGLYQGQPQKPCFCPVIPQWLIESRIAQGTMRINEGSLEKLCSRCREWNPADTEFYFIKREYADGMRPQCRFCEMEDSKRTRERRAMRKAA